MRENQVFEYTSGGMRSLAEDLRMRREVKEKLSIEKMKMSYNQQMNDLPTPLGIRQAAKADNFERRMVPR